MTKEGPVPRVKTVDSDDLQVESHDGEDKRCREKRCVQMIQGIGIGLAARRVGTTIEQLPQNQSRLPRARIESITLATTLECSPHVQQ